MVRFKNYSGYRTHTHTHTQTHTDTDTHTDTHTHTHPHTHTYTEKRRRETNTQTQTYTRQRHPHLKSMSTGRASACTSAKKHLSCVRTKLTLAAICLYTFYMLFSDADQRVEKAHQFIQTSRPACGCLTPETSFWL